MGFTGWSPDALAFYDGLEEDNSKDYWREHKDVYETAVREPMRELLAELEPTLGHGKIFRPNRDVRFSRNKAPYKENIAAILGGVHYVQFSAAGLAVGAGMWEMGTDQLQRYREAVDDATTGKKLAALVKKATSAGLVITAHGELKTAPRGYPKDHPRIELLRYKGLVTWQDWPVAAWLGTPKAKDRITTFFKNARPIIDWLDTNVGPSTLPPRHRGM